MPAKALWQQRPRWQAALIPNVVPEDVVDAQTFEVQKAQYERTFEGNRERGLNSLFDREIAI
jgi:hypothetical protein